MINKAMIMAAGVGTRLDPLTQSIPKPLIPVANQPIMQLILKHLKKYGIKDVIANTHYLADLIQDRFSENSLGVNFNYIFESQLSGTAGGVKKCESFLSAEDHFIVVSGDALTDVNIDELVMKHKSCSAIATMALKEIPQSEVSHFGVVVLDEEERVIEFQEKPSIEEARSNLVNTGIYVFDKRIFNYIPENTFYDFAKNVFPALMANNERLYAHVVEEYWNDIGTINQYKLSTHDVLNNKVKVDMPYEAGQNGWISDRARLSSTVLIDGRVIIGDNTVVVDKVLFSGASTVGNNCIIKDNVYISNSIIWDNVIIEEGARLDGCIVANNAIIGKKSTVPQGCIVSEGCIISDYHEMSEETRLNPGDEFSSSVAEIV